MSEIKREVVARVTGQQYVPKQTVEITNDQVVIDARGLEPEQVEVAVKQAVEDYRSREDQVHSGIQVSPNADDNKITAEQVEEALSFKNSIAPNLEKFFNDFPDADPNAAHLYDSCLEGSFDEVAQFARSDKFHILQTVNNPQTNGDYEQLFDGLLDKAPEPTRVIGSSEKLAGVDLAVKDFAVVKDRFADAPKTYINVAEAVRRFKELNPAVQPVVERPTLDDLRLEVLGNNTKERLESARALLRSSTEIVNQVAKLLEGIK